MKNNKFRIVIASHNNESWIEYNLASVINQTYTNWEVLYIDDASGDRTVELFEKITAGDRRFRIIRNQTNMGGTYNHLVLGGDGVEDDTIIVLLDGDDWFFDIFTLERLNEFYNKGDYWMTYGGLYVYRGELDVAPANPQNTEYSDFVHEHKLYRQDAWRASHLRSYRGFLWKALPLDVMRELGTGKFYWHAGDLALQFPMLEICGKERIGVIDFPSYVYNAHPANHQRTLTRQMDNDHYRIETEIRSRKKFQMGLPARKLPQVNVYGYPHSADCFPTKFSYVQNKTEGEFDVTQLTDFEIPNYITGGVKIPGKIVADLYEGRFFSNMNEIYELVYVNYQMFDLILTHDPKLLELPNAKLRMVMDRYHLTNHIDDRLGVKVQDDSVCIIHPKTKNISCVSSNKNFLPGHQRRLELLTYIINTEAKTMFDMYGRGFQEVGGKIDALRDYRFSIVIENSYTTNWATEKISDCFLTGTIPIYYGCPNIGDYFDLNGIITFQTEQELEEIILNLNENGTNIYNEKLDSVRKNYELVWGYSLNPDEHFEKYLEVLLDKTGIPNV